MSDLPPLSNRLHVEAGEAVSPRSRPFRERGGLQPLGAMAGRFKPTRVSSSTSPSRSGGSETISSDAHTQFGDVDPSLSAADRHFLGMLESDDISDAEADQAFNAYFF